MRVRLTLLPIRDEEILTIPLDFRHHFISLLKSLLSDSLLFRRFTEEKPGYSPYVFTVGFKDIVIINGLSEQMLIKTPVNLTISTGLFNVMTDICNGAIKMRHQNTVLGLKIQDVHLMPLYQIKSSHVEFRTIGHAIFRSPERYLDGSDLYQLEESINYHLITKACFLNKFFGPNNFSNDIGKVSLLPETRFRKGVCSHYGGKITSLQGHFILKGSPKSLQFLYDYGIGTRTGQGFGMLEVVQEL
ncbi:MAG: CRISPR-associated endoribonuclease Cas6 [Syntrophomonadaceae bacterium]